MKNLIFLFLLLILTRFGICQDYTPFDLDNGEWICGYLTKGGLFTEYGNDYVKEVVKFYCQGDTIINDTIYKNLKYIGYAEPTMSPQKNISGKFGALRNDTVNKRLWIKARGRYVILYDFNLDLGDSYVYNCDGTDATIYLIDSVKYCDRFHKQYNYKDSQNYNNYLIEGVGSNAGLIPNNCMTSSSYLICYSENNNADCDTCTTPTAIKETETNKLQIYPNPTNAELKVISEDPIKSIEVTDFLGRLIFNDNNINNSKAEISIQQKGILIFKIKTSNNTIIRKIIKN